MIIEDSRIEENQCPGATEASTIAAATTAATATTAAAEVIVTSAASIAVTDAPRQFPFKKPVYEHKNIVNGRRKPWRTLKQILSQVRYPVPGTDFYSGNCGWIKNRQ
jgi:hypothetical protein